jgi:hypothetical protein
LHEGTLLVAGYGEGVRELRPRPRVPELCKVRVLDREAYKGDFDVLLDRLDDLVHNAKTVPLTDQIRIDREEIYDILDQMRSIAPSTMRGRTEKSIWEE